jgi:hypothetical protein
MFKLFRAPWWVVLLVSLQLLGCASTANESASELQSSYLREDIAGAVVDDAETARIVLWGNTQYLLSFNDKQQVVARNLEIEGETKVISNAADDGRVKRIYLAAAASQGYLHTTWMEKNSKARGKSEGTGEKYITYSNITEGGRVSSTPQRISRGGGAFTPYLRASDNGDVFVLWTDERNGGKYDIYLNVSHDKGATWKAEETKLSNDAHLFVIDPVMEVVDNKLVVAWVQVDQQNTFNIVSRTSADRGETWSDLHTVYKGKDQPVSPQIVHSGSSVTACWATISGVGCAVSDDAGFKWTVEPNIPGTKLVGLIIAKADSKGRIHLISNQRSEDGTSAGLFYSSSDGKTGFSPAVPVSRQPVFQEKAISPTLEIDANDGVFVAWMDYFYIKPLINATFSVNGGNTWEKPYVLSYFARTDAQFFPVVNRNAAGSITLSYLSVGQKRNQWLTQNTTLTSPKNAYAPKIDADKLKARVDQYWNVRVKADWSKSYDFMDPFYRSSVDKDTYIKTQGKVKYYGFSQKSEPVISGVRAAVGVTYDSEVPTFMLDGKPFEIPRKETTTLQPWVWLDGEWYVVFEDLMGGKSIPK